jgi:hypothetical protein
MKSYSAYFVLSPAIADAQAIFGNAVESLPDSPWMMCGFCRDDEIPDDEVLFGEESLTAAKSQQLGEIIFVYGDTSQDWFVYEHARDGELLRKLIWCSLIDDEWNSGWVCVQGEAEDWEVALFEPSFNPHKLEQCLARARARLEDEERESEMPELEAEIRQAWKLKLITAGKTYPECDGTVAMLVEKSYGINRFS